MGEMLDYMEQNREILHIQDLECRELCVNAVISHIYYCGFPPIRRQVFQRSNGDGKQNAHNVCMQCFVVHASLEVRELHSTTIIMHVGGLMCIRVGCCVDLRNEVVLLEGE